MNLHKDDLKKKMRIIKDYEPVNEAIGNFVRNQLGSYIKPLKNFQDPKLKIIEKIINLVEILR